MDGVAGVHPGHVDVGIRGVSTTIAVARRDDDVAVGAAGEELLEVDLWVVGVVDQQQPLGTLLGEPAKRVVDRGSRRATPSDALERRTDGAKRAGIDVIYFTEPAKTTWIRWGGGGMIGVRVVRSLPVTPFEDELGHDLSLAGAAQTIQDKYPLFLRNDG